MSQQPTGSPAFDAAVLDLDAAAETRRLCRWIRDEIARGLRRRGAVVAVSGGVDSAVCATLACRALGADRTVALFLPERSTPPGAGDRVRALCAGLGVALVEHDIVPALAALGCYDRLDAAVRELFPDHPDGGRCKIAVGGDLLAADRLPLFDLVAEAPGGGTRRARMPLHAYLEVVAATNMKQRTRKLLEYGEAERRNFAVVGTPNRAEYEQGFFVRGGDGLADLEPIAHLYKTQVYALAEHLGVPAAIRAAPPSTDTYSLPQTQQEFFFGLDHRTLDLLLWARHHGVPEATVAAALGWTAAQVQRALREIEGKARTAARLHRAPLVVEPVTVAEPGP